METREEYKTGNEADHEKEEIPGVTVGQLTSLKEQFLALHKEFDDCRKRDGEFTAKEYGAIVGIGYERAYDELRKALADGRVKVRKARKFRFYRFVE